MVEKKYSILLDKVLENAEKNNCTIIEGTLLGANFLIIDWLNNEWYIYDYIHTHSGSKIAKKGYVFSFSELAGFGLEIQYTHAHNTHYKEYFGQLHTKDYQIIPKLWRRHLIQSLSEINSKDITAINFYLSYKEPDQNEMKYKTIYIYHDRYYLNKKEQLIKQKIAECETIETMLKRVIYIGEKKYYSQEMDKKLHFLENNISVGKKLGYLYDFFISNEINLEKFTQKKNSLLNAYTNVTSKNDIFLKNQIDNKHKTK